MTPSRKSGRSIDSPPPTYIADLPESQVLGISHINYDHKWKIPTASAAVGVICALVFTGQRTDDNVLVDRKRFTCDGNWMKYWSPVVTFDFVGLVMLSISFSSSYSSTFPSVVQFCALTSSMIPYSTCTNCSQLHTARCSVVRVIRLDHSRMKKIFWRGSLK